MARERAHLNDWLGFCQRLDAAASGRIMGIDDAGYTATSYPDQKLLDHWLPYARRCRLSMFAEDRASWLNKPLSRLVHLERSSSCRLEIEGVDLTDFTLSATQFLDYIPQGIAATPDGTKVLVTGSTHGTQVFDGATLAYTGSISGGIQAGIVMAPQ